MNVSENPTCEVIAHVEDGERMPLTQRTIDIMHREWSRQSKQLEVYQKGLHEISLATLNLEAAEISSEEKIKNIQQIILDIGDGLLKGYDVSPNVSSSG